MKTIGPILVVFLIGSALLWGISLSIQWLNMPSNTFVWLGFAMAITVLSIIVFFINNVYSSYKSSNTSKQRKSKSK